MDLHLKRSLLIGLSALSLLILPLIATLTIADFNWSSFDFIVFGLLLFVFGTAISWARVLKGTKRFAVIIGLILLLLLLWVELGVGILGTPLAGS